MIQEYVSLIHYISLLSNRKYNVFLNGEVDRCKYLKNGLPQDTLFNVYISDIVNIVSRKFIYAVDIALKAQAKNFTTV